MLKINNNKEKKYKMDNTFSRILLWSYRGKEKKIKWFLIDWL